MIKKVITVAVRVIVICLAAEAVREVWNPNEEEERKEEENK